MIFISKKSLNDEVDRRMAEIHFKNRTDEKIWKMEEEIRNLKFRVECLEERDRTPVPKQNTSCACEVKEYANDK